MQCITLLHINYFLLSPCALCFTHSLFKSPTWNIYRVSQKKIPFFSLIDWRTVLFFFDTLYIFLFFFPTAEKGWPWLLPKASYGLNTNTISNLTNYLKTSFKIFFGCCGLYKIRCPKGTPMGHGYPCNPQVWGFLNGVKRVFIECPFSRNIYILFLWQHFLCTSFWNHGGCHKSDRKGSVRRRSLFAIIDYDLVLAKCGCFCSSIVS